MDLLKYYVQKIERNNFKFIFRNESNSFKEDISFLKENVVIAFSIDEKWIERSGILTFDIKRKKIDFEYDKIQKNKNEFLEFEKIFESMSNELCKNETYKSTVFACYQMLIKNEQKIFKNKRIQFLKKEMKSIVLLDRIDEEIKLKVYISRENKKIHKTVFIFKNIAVDSNCTFKDENDYTNFKMIKNMKKKKINIFD